MLAERSERTTRSHVGALPALVGAVLHEAGVAWRDLDGLAISIGPGSFTGLRIGLAFVKGLAYAADLPVAAVPTLEALAVVAEAPPDLVVWAALDARMREVYAASFARRGDALVRRTFDEALAPETVAARLDAASVLVGDAADVYPALCATAARRLPFATHHPRGGVVARLGAARLRAGDAAAVGPLEPVYVRASQAERASGGSR